MANSVDPDQTAPIGMRKFRIGQDFLIENWHMIYAKSVVFAEIYNGMKLKLNFRCKININ